MERKTLPTIDWELAKKLAGNKVDLANDIFAMLSQSLPDEVATIQQLARAKKYPELYAQVHRLHGAVAYCGTPRLKALLASMDTKLKAHQLNDLPMELDELNAETDAIIIALSQSNQRSRS